MTITFLLIVLLLIEMVLSNDSWIEDAYGPLKNFYDAQEFNVPNRVMGPTLGADHREHDALVILRSSWRQQPASTIGFIVVTFTAAAAKAKLG